ncbi:MAG: HDOD domain-containing protein [Ketobacter sp. GenoA1]|nr:MAG: HDOD domain-containing protein [Ketobacter sp. GenoA1]RLT97850.1 MAG: HDOD domain-containing protein [Ketobacter sp.]
MEMAQSLERYLRSMDVAFSIHPHEMETSLSKLCSEMGIGPEQTAVPIVLRTQKQAFLMAVVPLDHSLDLDRLSGLLRREFLYLDEAEVSAWFLDSEPGAEPPIAEPYELPCIVDRSLFEQPRVFMRAGSHRALISMDNANLQRLYQAYPKAVISNPSVLPLSDEPLNRTDPTSIIAIYNALDNLDRLPSIPVLAMQLLEQASSEQTTAAELASTIEMDPSVTAQVMRYAGSPYFGYRGNLDSVQDAITRVLGFELVSNIALAIASSKAFNVPQEGPLGMRAFWKHALYTAVLAQSLAKKINRPQTLNPPRAYLCGLLHNIGVLLSGHLFPQEFRLLNHEMERYPQRSLSDIEQNLVITGDVQRFIRLGHDHLGGYLLEKWRLPQAVSTCAYYHHDAEYVGEHAEYVMLIQLCNRLLAQRKIGDLGRTELHAVQTGGLISDADAFSVLEKVMAMCPELDNLADNMAA